jgi:teichoic acid transport system ATP-binding protein
MDADDEDSPTPGAPTVICNNLHVVYRVVAQGGGSSAATSVRKILSGQGRGKVYKRVHAVRGVSFVAQEGDAIALIGRNGSGKSTLLRTIAGLIPAESGEVYTSGRPSLLGVNAALIRHLSGERNILLGCMAMGMTREQARARREWIMEFADLGEFINLPMSTYSSGMAARLRFAIAASMSHEILMVDEALATGDAEFRRRSEQRIMELREEAGTVFLVSHSLGVVRMTCNRAIWLEKGQIVMDGEANEVVDAYEDLYDPEAEAEERRKRRIARRRQRRAERRAAREVALEARARREAASAEAAAAEWVEPTGAEPGSGPRAEGGPAATPTASGPAPVVPGNAQPGNAQPGNAQPGNAQPGNAQPGPPPGQPEGAQREPANPGVEPARAGEPGPGALDEPESPATAGQARPD